MHDRYYLVGGHRVVESLYHVVAGGAYESVALLAWHAESDVGGCESEDEEVDAVFRFEVGVDDFFEDVDFGVDVDVFTVDEEVESVGDDSAFVVEGEGQVVVSFFASDGFYDIVHNFFLGGYGFEIKRRKKFVHLFDA